MSRLPPYALPLFVVASVAATVWACTSIHAGTADQAAAIDAVVSPYVEDGGFTGTVLVSMHDAVVFKKGYGLANREWNVPNRPDVRFRLGSITKQFTAMLVMQQVAKGTLRLDGHLIDYLPYYRKDTGSRVTIHQLLNHTSGIPSYTDDPRFFPEVSRDYHPVEEFVKQFCSGDLQFEPGTTFRYDNSGYFILGAVLEQVTGQSYQALLKAQILEPLGMRNTGYDRGAEVLPMRAAGYQRGLGEVQNAPYLDMALPYAAGALYSTVEDLYTWDQALYTDRLLPADLKQRMFTPGLENYAYGWVVRTVPADEPGAGQTMIAHGGGINGFNTLEQRLVGDHVLIALLNNTPGADLDVMAKGIRAVLYGRTPEPTKRSLTRTLGDTLAARGAEAAVAQYRELKRTQAAGYAFANAERELNTLGYQLLGRNRAADAIAIFRLNVEEYPRSSNVYDSLAEGYEKTGDTRLAIENYRQSVALDPKNQHALDRLKALGQ